MLCHRHGYPWPSLAISPYHSSPLVGLQGHILSPHVAAECMFELVVLLLPGHMWGSIGVHHLWARPCFYSMSGSSNLDSFCDGRQMCYNQTGDITILDGTHLKLVDKFTYRGSSISSIEKDIDTRLTKAWIAIDRLLIIWKSDLTDKMKCSFFQAAVVSILLYGCTTRTLTKRLEKKLDGNYTRMLRAILNKSWTSTIVGYLMPNPLYTYILNKWISKHLL